MITNNRAIRTTIRCSERLARFIFFSFVDEESVIMTTGKLASAMRDNEQFESEAKKKKKKKELRRRRRQGPLIRLLPFPRLQSTFIYPLY